MIGILGDTGDGLFPHLQFVLIFAADLSHINIGCKPFKTSLFSGKGNNIFNAQTCGKKPTMIPFALELEMTNTVPSM